MPESIAVETSRAEWRRNWRVPVVSAVALGVSVIPVYSLGALMASIHATTGWSRSQISTGPTLISVCTVLLSPFIGAAIDRFGSRRIGLPGIAFYCAAVACISLVSSGIYTWWAAWLLVAVAYASVKMTVWTAAVVTLFERSRGMALGVTLAGLGLGSTTLPYLTTLLEEHFGWRGAYVALAAGGFLLAFPLLWFFFYDAGDRAKTERRLVDRSLLSGATPREAFGSRRYLQMAFACLFAAVPSTAFVVHFVPIVRAGGLSAHAAAAVAGVIGISSIVGRLSGGYLLDRFRATVIGFISCALPVLSGPVLLFNHGAAAAVFAAAMIGLSAGSEIGVLAYMIPQYFGTGSYNHFLLLSIPLFAISAVLLGTLGEPNLQAAALAAPADASPAFH